MNDLKNKAWLIKRLNELRKSCSESAVPPDKGYYTAKAQAYKNAMELAELLEICGKWTFRSNAHNIKRDGDYEEWYECSVCGSSADCPSAYCPNCGTLMDGKRRVREAYANLYRGLEGGRDR